jgi:hypothetical protein
MVSSAGLPDPASPSIVAFSAAVGVFLGTSLARRRGLDRERQAQAAVEGGYYGTAIGLTLYLAANLSTILDP